jgi:hypothetical protein
MSQSIVGALRVTLGLDSAQFTRGAKEAETRVAKLGSQMQKFGAAMSLVSAGIVAAMRSQLNAADEVGKVAQRVGVTTEALSQLRYAADLSAVSAGQLETGLKQLSRAMAEDAKEFERLGVAVRDAAGQMRPTEAVLMDVADALARMPDGAEKTAAAMKVFGRAGADLIPMLNGGADGLRRMMGEADALGKTISQDTANAAARFNDALTKLRGAIGGITTQIAAELAPVLANIAEAVANVAAGFAKLSPEARRVAAVVATITAAVGPAALAVGSLIRAISLLRLGLIALTGPVGIAVGLLTAAGAGFIAMRESGEKLPPPIEEARRAIGLLNEITADFVRASPQTKAALLSEADGYRQKAVAALQAAEAVLAAQRADLAASQAASRSGSNRTERNRLRPQIAAQEALIASLSKELSDASARVKGMANEFTGGGGLVDAIKTASSETKELNVEVKAAAGRIRSEVPRATEAFGSLESAVGGLSSAFGDFVAGGLQDFRGFVASIGSMFTRLISDMVAQAASARIVQALGIGGAATGAATGAAAAGAAGAAGAATGGIGGTIASIGAALGPVGIAVGGAALIGGFLFGRSRRRRQREAQRRAADAARQQAIQQEAVALEVRLLQLQGDTAELRRRELEALDPANRAIAERIFALQDEQEASAAARQAADERTSLERRLLELQGNTVELRRREIAALDPSNRALQEQIFALEDARTGVERINEALGKLDANDFATALDFGRARASLAFGGGAAPVPTAANINGVMAAQSQHLERQDALQTSVNVGIDYMRRVLTRWDIDGIPATRTA